MEQYHLDAGLARGIFSTAEAGDHTAQGVIRWAGEELGSLAAGVIRQLVAADEAVEVVLVGSLYNGGPRLLDPMRETVHKTAPQAYFTRLETPPVVGGVLLGMEQGGQDPNLLRPVLIETTKSFLDS